MAMDERRYGLSGISQEIRSSKGGRRPTSGVISLVANPVPPLTTTRLTQFGPSVQSQMERWISNTLSGTILITAVPQLFDPSAEMTVVSVSPTLSVDGSCEAVSETIKIAALRVLSAIVEK